VVDAGKPPVGAPDPAAPTGTTFAVEEGKVRELVAAVGHPSRLYRADAVFSGGLPAPLVFSRASVFSEHRSTPVSDALGVAPSELRHAGHRWAVTGPLLAGRRYRVSTWAEAGARETASATGRPLRFVDFDRTICAGDGECVQRERMTVVVAISVRPAVQAGADRARASEPPAPPVVREEHPWTGRSPGELVERVDAAWLSRTSIVRFAGAIGDFTPIHHDTEEARRRGLPDVIAMGMLPAAVLLARAEAALGPGAARACTVQFRRAVYPGESLSLEVRACGDAGPGGEAFSLVLLAAGAPAVTAILEVDREAAEDWIVAG
jgi:acyl dehydratase